jgi:hypothetical protein
MRLGQGRRQRQCGPQAGFGTQGIACGQALRAVEEQRFGIRKKFCHRGILDLPACRSVVLKA